jgi:carboxyl-terminal processing protease
MKALLLGLVAIFLMLRPVAAADTAPPPGPIVGIGVGVRMVDHHPVIEEVIPANPAAKAGLKVGDRIVKIDGTSTDGLELGKVAMLLRGAAETHVKVTILRNGDKQTFTIKRRIVTLVGPNGEPTGQ